MKKKYLYIGLFLELAACVGAYLMQYFTKKKMGMLRWVNGICNKWSKAADLDAVYGIIMVVVAVLVLLLLFWVLNRGRDSCADALTLGCLVSAGIYIAFTVAYSRKLVAAYYLVSPVLLIGTLAGCLCLALAVKR